MREKKSSNEDSGKLAARYYRMRELSSATEISFCFIEEEGVLVMQSPRKLSLDYEGPEGCFHFDGSQIKFEGCLLGSLVNVELAAERSPKLLSLALPRLTSRSGRPQPFSTIAVKTADGRMSAPSRVVMRLEGTVEAFPRDHRRSGETRAAVA